MLGRKRKEMNIKRILSIVTAAACMISVGSFASTANAVENDAAIANCMAEPSPFRDVNSKTPHAEDIQWMYCTGISEGWNTPQGREYRGTSPVIRQDMAAFLRRLAVASGISDAADWIPARADWGRFADVGRATPHAEDVLWLAHSGISTGWKESNGRYTFRPQDTVKRQDMAAFLYRLAELGGVEPGWEQLSFVDVTNATPHAREIRWLGGVGISTGWLNENGSRSYRGMANTLRQDMSAFLHRTSDVVEEKGGHNTPDSPSKPDNPDKPGDGSLTNPDGNKVPKYEFTVTDRYAEGKRFTYKLTDVWVNYKNYFDSKSDKPYLHLSFDVENTGSTTDYPFLIPLRTFQDKVRTDYEYLSGEELQPGGDCAKHIAFKLNDATTSINLLAEDTLYDFDGNISIYIDPQEFLTTKR